MKPIVCETCNNLQHIEKNIHGNSYAVFCGCVKLSFLENSLDFYRLVLSERQIDQIRNYLLKFDEKV